MPVLVPAPLPVLATPGDLTNPFRESRTMAFVTLDGTSLLQFTGNEIVALWGAQGLDVPDRDVIENTIPGLDGSVIADVKIGSRTVVLPIFIASNAGHLGFLTSRQILRKFWNHRKVNLRDTDGSFDLVVSSVLGERSLRCTYKSGASGNLTQDSSGSWWETMAVTLVAPRTYWYGADWATPVISQPAPVDWFGDFPPELSTDLAFGDAIPVLVNGDVESWGRLDVIGPADSVMIAADGLSISIPDGLSIGESLVLDTNPRSRTATFNGVVDWSRIAPSDSYAPLQPGLQHISIVMPGSTSQTQAIVSGPTLWETPW